MNGTNPQVDEFFRSASKWREELEHLRAILLSYPLTEELKWGKPCYTFAGKNVVIMLPLKRYCALLFAKGALLKDPEGILIQPTENTQAARQLRLSNLQQIKAMEPILESYVCNAVEVEKAGLEVTYKTIAEFRLPVELEQKLEEAPALQTAFRALTPGRQRGYILFFSAAKQSKTRMARLERCRQTILAGKGLND